MFNCLFDFSNICTIPKQHTKDKSFVFGVAQALVIVQLDPDPPPLSDRCHSFSYLTLLQSTFEFLLMEPNSIRGVLKRIIQKIRQRRHSGLYYLYLRTIALIHPNNQIFHCRHQHVAKYRYANVLHHYSNSIR